MGGSNQPSSQEKKKPEMLLMVTSHMVPRSRVVSKFHTFNTDTGLLNSSGQFTGMLVSLDISGNVLYWCQKGPNGIYKNHFSDEMMQTRTRTITRGNCKSVAADTKQRKVFYIDRGSLFGCDQATRRRVKLPIKVRASSTHPLATDKLYHMLYLYSKMMNTIWIYNYKGRLLTTAKTKHTIRGLLLYSHGQILYYTRQDVRTKLIVADALPGKGLRLPVKVRRTLSWKPITGFGVTRHWIVLVSNRTFQMHNRSTLKKKVRGGGDFELKDPFRIFSFDDI